MKKTIYLFHFIVSETIKNHIDYLKKELNFKKDINLYEFLLEIMSKNLPQLKAIIGDHQSEYALIDSLNIPRVNKYARLKEKNYKMLKKWHSDFNEYGMSSIMRDIIKIVYNGVFKYGAENFLEMISKKLDVKRIRNDVKDILTHVLGISDKKTALFTIISQKLSFYTQ